MVVCKNGSEKRSEEINVVRKKRGDKTCGKKKEVTTKCEKMG